MLSKITDDNQSPTFEEPVQYIFFSLLFGKIKFYRRKLIFVLGF